MEHSFAVFGPQGAAPSVSYLRSIREYIIGHPVLKCIKDEISTLQDVLDLVSERNSAIAALPQAPEYMSYFFQWLVDGNPEKIAAVPSTITALPRLCIIHVVQYFQFLESRHMSHADFLGHVRQSGGGMQGYCGGMPATAALSSAVDDKELAQNIITAIRLTFAIGLYTELGDDTRVPGLAIMVVRVEREDQAHQLVEKFPGTYVSAFTDPRNISVVGPTEPLEALKVHATEQGFLVQPLEIRGKVHNPENMELAHELSSVAAGTELLRLPMADALQCPARSNRDGQVIPAGRMLSDDVLYTILASRSEWYKVLQGVAENLKKTGADSHGCISLGIGDFIPLMPFNKLGLRVKKTEWNGLEATEETPEMPSYEYPEDSIAIVGSSCRLPGARNLHELWDIISTGQDRHEELKEDRFDIYGGFRALQSGNFAKNRKWYGNFFDGIDNFDRAFFGMNPREATNMDPQQRMLLELAYEAMESYGYTKSHVRTEGDNVGCFIGASFTEYLENAYSHAPTAYTAPGTIRAFLCGRISYHFGWTGPSEVIDTACSASLVAVNRAVKAIRGGECPIAIAGGVNIISGVHNYLDLARAGFLSPTGQCKPWDKDADGYCRSDGIGLVVLKSLRQAQADGDRIMAVIAGAATNQGGLSSSITNPDPVQQARLYRSVLDQAGMSPEQVTYVEAHGTGTQAGDMLETTSLRNVFGSPDRATQLTLGSIKGNIGHCETAAGIAGLLKVLSMLEYGAIPPQASHTSWNPKIPSLDPDRMAISKSLKKWDAPFQAALVNSFGAAGSNATVLCCQPPKTAAPTEYRTGQTAHVKYPVILSAKSDSSLRNFRDTLSTHLVKSLKTKHPLNIAQVAFTLSEKRARYEHSMVVEASSTEELAGILLKDDVQLPISATQEKRPVVLVFGGQSKQTVGLGKDMYEAFPAFRSHIVLCNDYLQKRGFPSILPCIFETAHNLNDIVALQTGHVAVQYAAASTWLESGLRIDSVIGHSLGELSALAVSGKLSIYDTLELVAQRARLMQNNWGEDHGAMLAVFGTRQVVFDALSQLSRNGKHKLEIACFNSETSQVVSGDSSSSAEFERILKAQAVKYVRVDTSHGFHSRLVEPIIQKLDRVASTLTWQRPTIDVELCRDEATVLDASYSPSAHAREPVFFANAVQRLESKLGAATWLEAGVDTPIMGMLKRALKQPKQHELIAGTTKDTDAPADLVARMVGRLWKFAAPVTHWAFLHDTTRPMATWLPPYAFDRTSAWLENIDRASEVQRGKDEQQPQADLQADAPQQQPLRLIMPLSETDADKQSGTRRFRVTVRGERFQTIVAGHAVRGRPLCPASVYLEFAAMALQHVLGEQITQQSNLAYKDLEILAPLGLLAQQEVDTVLQELPSLAETHQYHFSVVSRHPNKPGEQTLHAKGRVVVSAGNSDSQLNTMARLVERNLKTLERSAGSERMLSGRVYKLFSRVVDYGRVLQGIADMTVNGNEAIATIEKTAEGRPGASESTVLRSCDSVTLDGFIQVAGLNMNTSDGVRAGEVMICNGIDSSVVAHGFDFDRCSSYQVYTSFSWKGTSQAIGDVFAWSADGVVVAAFLGCRFAKLGISRLEKLLDPANSIPGEQSLPMKHPHQIPVASTMPSPYQLTASKLAQAPDSGYSSRGPASERETSPSKIPAESDVMAASPQGPDVLGLLQTYTGASAAMLVDEAVISELGLDSLAATELASEIKTSDGRPIRSEELGAMTVKQLRQRVGEETKAARPPKVTPPTMAAGIQKRPAVAQPQTSKVEPSQPVAAATATSVSSAAASHKVMDLLVETTGMAASAIDPALTLAEIGVDSLALSEIVSALSDLGPRELNTGDISTESRVSAVLGAVAA